MAVYLNGIGAIAPVPSFEAPGTIGAQAPKGDRLACIEPNYAAYIDPRLSRRMSRIVKMGITAAKQALQDAGLGAEQGLDGVIAGTGWGCLEDTLDFLQKLVVNKEEMLSPTAFIHSTHNTIAGQIAYQLKCRGYNSTYAHRNISFESALLDAFLQLEEQTAATLLVGGVDELTDTSFDILSRLGAYKAPANSPAEGLYSEAANGAWAGEGATFFAVSNVQGPSTYAQLRTVRTVSFSTPADAALAAQWALQAQGLAQADLLLSGYNGDFENDAACRAFEAALGHTGEVQRFKHLCGEYPTSSAFALALAASQLKHKAGQAGVPTSILIYNRAQQDHQSIYLLTAC